MQPSFVTLQEAATLIGRPGNAGRTWLTRHIVNRQEETGHVIIHDTKPKRVNVGELRQLCPELFPVEYTRAASQIRAELKRIRRLLHQLQVQLEQATEAGHSLYEDVMDQISSLRIEHERSPAIAARAMGEDDAFRLPVELGNSESKRVAQHGPTQETLDAAHDAPGE